MILLLTGGSFLWRLDRKPSDNHLPVLELPKFKRGSPLKHKLLPYLALAAGVLSLTISSFLIRWANAPAPVFAFYRMFIGGLIVTPFAFKSGLGQKVRLSKAMYLPILGGIFTAADLSLWTAGVQKTTIANATLLSNTAPIWVVLALWLVFKQKFTGKFWIGLILAFTGAGIVLGYDIIHRPHFGVGDTMSIVSSMFYAGYYLATQFGRKKLGVAVYIWFVSLAASAALLVISLVMGYPVTGYSLQTYLAFFAAGVIVQGLGYASVAYALGHLPASIVAPTMILQPIASALLAIPIYREFLLPIQWLGIIAVLSGVYLINRSNVTEHKMEVVESSA